jgi:DNA polymerase III alpha subunit
MDYFKAMKPLADNGIPQIYSTVEHGWQGNYFKIYSDLEKFNKKNAETNPNYTPIKFIFGVEGYWVWDRFEKDNANCHIVLLAKNDNGRKKLNRIIYESYKTGYYYKGRMDIDLLLKLPKDDVMVTTACVAFWNKYDIDKLDKFVLKLNNHFTDFYLEVQANNTELQKKVNNHILELHRKYNIPIISATDSHMISSDQEVEREELLISNSIKYEDEEGNYMDFPSCEELIKRYKEQGVLNESEITEAIENTNRILDFEDIVLDKSLKVPVAKKYRGLSQEERNKILFDILLKEWKLQRDDINENLLEEYQKEIMDNYNEIIACNMADYFIDSYEIMKLGQEKYGGILTPSGRGSAVSFYLNKLLRLTKVDKVNSPVTMYAERFLTSTRVLESRTPPDVDNNCSSREPFIQAQRDLIGEEGTFDLLALGTLKYKSAFKMYSRVYNLDPELANEVTKQIDKYENALKHMDEDETEEDYDIFDYVDKQKYGHLIEGCQKYRGIVDTLKSHPCGTLCYGGDAIEDVGVIMVRSESTGRECFVALQESSTIDEFGYLKQDYLIVDSIGLTYDIYKEIGIEPMTVNELLKTIKDDKPTWDIYANGHTMCINQVEKQKTTQKAMRYKPQNISELCQFIAGIRPSFQSMYNIFESRKHFDYGIKAFDDVVQDEYMTSSFLLYQETLMKVLGFAGFPMSETYTIIKAISKKKKYIIDGAKEKFVPNFTRAILDTKETEDEEVAKQMAEKVWTVIESSASYGFNSSHSYCMAIDSVTLAWLKAHYPLEFYKCALQRYTNKGNKNKVEALKKEMVSMGVELMPIKFGDDNRDFSIDREHNVITQTMSGIKNMGKEVSDNLYALKDRTYSTFVDLLYEIWQTKACNKTELEILIKLDYFKEFGNIQQLLMTNQMFRWFMFGKSGNSLRKTIKREDCNEQIQEIVARHCEKATEKQFSGIDNLAICKECEQLLHYTTNPLMKLYYEVKYLGYTNIVVESPYYAVEAIETNKWGNTFVTLYKVSNGQINTFKVIKKEWSDCPMEQGDIVDCMIAPKEKVTKGETGWVGTGEYEDVVQMYSIKFREN